MVSDALEAAHCSVKLKPNRHEDSEDQYVVTHLQIADPVKMKPHGSEPQPPLTSIWGWASEGTYRIEMQQT